MVATKAALTVAYLVASLVVKKAVKMVATKAVQTVVLMAERLVAAKAGK